VSEGEYNPTLHKIAGYLVLKKGEKIEDSKVRAVVCKI
jgi:hypothetical protein